MADIPTRDVKCPQSGAVVTLKEYVLGHDQRAIENIYIKGKQAVGPGQKSIQFEGEIVSEAENESLRRAVVAVDGNTDNVVQAVLNLPLKDYSFIVQEVRELFNPYDEEKKADSSSSTPNS